ncbi:MAG: FGGY-family carbohydrate kinase [Planctomycetota bacterium]
MPSACFLGIDVGTGSARAGLFDRRGKLLGSHAHPIQMWKPAPDFVEQSSDDIWRACCRAAQGALKAAGIGPRQSHHIQGIGFDATCSLVALGDGNQPVTVSPTGRDEQNVIVWMDHRATEIAAWINAKKHPVLKYVGGVISPEMQSPKLLWLKQHLLPSWRRATRFFDLPDFLTWRATGDDTRSLCTTVCKWTYLGHAQRPARSRAAADSAGAWDDSYWKQIGLGEFPREGYARIGARVRPMGEPLGAGLTARAARELGLAPGTAVGVSIIDAHAGGLGMIGAALDGASPSPTDLERRLALIGGTSSCHMAVSRKPRFVPGVWGPYFSAMVPGMWLTEGGQSATGALIDHVILSHARGPELAAEARRGDTTVYALLNERLAALARDCAFPAELTRDLHVEPDFHGNRSPRADPTLTGMIAGLKLSSTVDDLARLYLATIQAVAHGTRHIVDSLNAKGFHIDTLFACGGGTKNPVFLREHADITGCNIVLPAEPEAVLLGAAVLGAVAGGAFASVPAAMAAMNRAGRRIAPAADATARFHRAKHKVFHRMFEDQMAYRKLML